MNPQYMSTQQPQYPMGPQQGYNPGGPGLQQWRPPQQQAPPQPVGMPQMPPSTLPARYPPVPTNVPATNYQQMPTPTSPPAQPPQPSYQANHLAGQMASMNLNGVQNQVMPPGQQGFAPPVKPPTPAYPGQVPAVNGAGPGQMVNGVGDGRGPVPPSMQPRYPHLPENNLHQGGFPPQPGMPPQAGMPSQPGMPPQPGMHPQPGMPPQSYPQPPMQQAQGYNPQQPPYTPQGYPSAQQGYGQPQKKALDPDNMPSPMQVMDDDLKSKGGILYTNQKGLVPPLVTTKFVVQDQGNCSPRFLRSTMYNVPITADIMKQTSVPFGLIISPMAEIVDGEKPPPLVDMGDLGPVRCIRCKAYMCPNMQFIDGGRRFHCLLCKATTEVPQEYFQHLDHTGHRVDRYDRAELVLGAYEFVATKEYCKDYNFPKPPALIFLLDVSYNNVKSGLVHLMCSEMKRFLRSLPKDPTGNPSPMRVGFITYNNCVHFYNVNANLVQPQMLVVGDVNEMFMPLLDGFLVDPIESEAVIDTLMEQIPNMFANTKETETILYPAIQAGLEALKASERSGKLLIFHSSLPTAEAPGKLKNRDDRKLLGTEKEKTVLAPQNSDYNNLGQDCVAAGCSVDLFIFNNSYIDLATIGQVSRLTGGGVFKYTYFQAELDGERLVADVERTISRLCAFEAIMRVRTSTGVRPTDVYGHYFMSNTTDVELACIDADKAIAVEVKHDDKLSEDDGVYVQVALLYTAVTGQRRVRVLNVALKSCSQMNDLYRACELDTLVNFFAKQAIFKLSETAPKIVKDGLTSRAAQILACYRKNCAQQPAAGQLVLPECMKLLPLYVNCLLKSDALSGGSDMTVDDRWFIMSAVTTMDIPSSVVYFYPRLLALHDMKGDEPAPVRSSIERMQENGVYLLENGIYMFLWIGQSVQSEWLMSVFGVPSTNQVNPEKNKLPELDNPLSERVRGIICSVCNSCTRSMRLTIVRQRDKMELVMKHFLVEDRGMDGVSPSYVDYLCHMHKEIRSILS